MRRKNNIILFKALSEETRYKIVEVLLRGEKCACEIPVLIGRTQSNTSMQLLKLVNVGVLKSRREGKKIIYSVNDSKVYDVFKALGHPER
jgi:ArsR family transcriptional regulator, lead/cadmium/zinc/bismuth-responsive transcriptional repressor